VNYWNLLRPLCSKTDITVYIPARILYLQRSVTFWKEDVNGMRISDELVTWYSSSQTSPYTLQTIVQWNSNLFENRQTVAQTVKPHHTRSNCLCNSLCCANCLTMCRAPTAHVGTRVPSSGSLLEQRNRSKMR
jgi:hypothetical protein